MVGCWFMTGPTADAMASSHEETASRDKVTEWEEDILRVLNVKSQFPKKKFSFLSKTLARHTTTTRATHTRKFTGHDVMDVTF